MELANFVLSTTWASALDLVPVIVVLLVFQLAVLRRPLPSPRQIGLGLMYVFVGMTLFLVGLHEAPLPIGRTMALQLAEASAQAGAAKPRPTGAPTSGSMPLEPPLPSLPPSPNRR